MPGVKGQRSGGANRISSQLHVLRGTFRGDRHGAADIPDLPKEIPKPRKPLTGEAKAEWERVVAELEAAKSIATIDGSRLYQYVSLFAEVEDIKAQAAVTKSLLNRAKGAIRKLDGLELIQALESIVKLQQLVVRQTSQLRQGRMSLRQYINDLGMTPVARHGKVPAGGEKPKSAVDRFRAGGGVG